MTGHKDTRVLIVEDDYLVSEMIQGILEELGYTVIGETGNGHRAIEITKRLRPDVILMDIKMPELSGIEIARQISAQHPTPIVVLTAYETPELVEDASAAGVGAYLTKPPNGAEIERAITIAIARFNDIIELRRLNENLQSYNRELDAFAHTVAHDLQNPLSLVIGFADLLVEDYGSLSENETRQCLNTIATNAHKMSNIVDELLLLAGVRQMTVTPRPLEIRGIVFEAMQRLAYAIKEKKAEIVRPSSWPAAVGYGPWVEEVWVNYISNALKYGGDPPYIELGAEELPDGMVRFWVRDNGPGLSEEDQQRLFTPFTQLEQIRAKGHGLGLSIVQRIVTKLEGAVGVESQLGGGSTFWFTLPAPK